MDYTNGKTDNSSWRKCVRVENAGRQAMLKNTIMMYSQKIVLSNLNINVNTSILKMSNDVSKYNNDHHPVISKNCCCKRKMQNTLKNL